MIAGLMILAIGHLTLHAKPFANTTQSDTEHAPPSHFWKEWKEGIDIVRKNRVIGVLFVTVVLLNFGGIMIDPLGAPYMIEIVKVGPDVFGWLITVQAIGGMIGGLLVGKLNQKLSIVQLYGWAELILGLFIFIRYNIPYLPVLFVMTFLLGLPAALGSAALDTLFQQKVPNSYLGRIIGALNTTVGLTSLFGVLGISGILGERLGMIPVLNIAAGITALTGLIVLLFLPADQETKTSSTSS
jgi:predicted MFS family arabinose efflux permease